MLLNPTQEATVWLCRVASDMNVLLDQHETLDVVETRRHILDGDLFAWIDRRLPHAGLGMAWIPTLYQAELHERFRNLAVAGTEGRYCVHGNGLCVLLSYCLEGLQQLAGVAR